MEDSKREYSEIEIEVAKNLLAKGYEWIARDEGDALYAYECKPGKGGHGWNYGEGVLLLADENARGVIPIFDDINWEDAEPVRLRDIVPKILTDEEREWLKVVVKPFRDRLKSVDVHDGSYYGRYVAFIIAYPGKRRDDIGRDVEHKSLPAEHKSLPVQEDWFKGIEDYKNYTPEELGL